MALVFGSCLALSALSVPAAVPGTVVAWGDNLFGQGVVVTGLTNITAISAGYLHNILLRSNGVAVAWGWNGYGQTNIPNNSNIIAVAAGGLLTMVLPDKFKMMPTFKRRRSSRGHEAQNPSTQTTAGIFRVS